MEKKYDKYFEEGKVDKIEIPKDFYDDAKKEYSERRVEIEKQIKSAQERGDTSTLAKKTLELERVNKRDSMIEKSNTKLSEAMQASKNPTYFSAKTMFKPVVNEGVSDGIKQAETAMIVTSALSTVDNVSLYMDGEITAEDAVINIGKDTLTAGGGAFAAEFVSSSAAAMMRNSSNQLIREVGNASRGNTVAIAVSYGVEVHEAVLDYAQGTIDNKEFADELGRGASRVAGGALGGKVGAVAGPIGSYYGAQIGSEVGEITYETSKTVINTGIDVVQGEVTTEEASETVEKAFEDAANETVSVVEEYKEPVVELVSKTVNYVVTSEAYATAVEKIDNTLDKQPEELKKLEAKAIECAKQTVEKASDFGQETVNDVKAAINKFNVKNSLPFKI